MREEGLVAFRRDAQTVFYRIADPRVEDLLATLHRLYCPLKGQIHDYARPSTPSPPSA